MLYVLPPQVFAYDYCFWSMDDSQTDKFAGLYPFLSSYFGWFCGPICCKMVAENKRDGCRWLTSLAFLWPHSSGQGAFACLLCLVVSSGLWAGQDVVFQCLGESLLDNAFMGYNACIFAYGQTGETRITQTLFFPLQIAKHWGCLILLMCAKVFTVLIKNTHAEGRGVAGGCYWHAVNFIKK